MTEPGLACCGKRPVGVVGQPIVAACRLCPNAPTYWRNQSTTAPVESTDSSGVCATCKEPTDNRDRSGCTRCETCCEWLGVAHQDTQPTPAANVPAY